MRKLLISALLASGLALSGCSSVLPAVLGSVLQGGLGGGGLGGQGYGNTGQQFQSAAVNACGQQASQYGQVSVTNVQQVSSSTLRVDGRIAVNGGFQQRSFTCSFRSDGRITDFRVG